LPVLPIGLFLFAGLDGIGRDVYEETLWGRPFLRFEYAAIGLPTLDATQYYKGENLLGLALSALMKLPKENRALLLAEGLQRIEGKGQNDFQKLLLSECMENYFPLSEVEQGEYQKLLTERFTQGKTAMNGLELRELRGARKGRNEMLVKQLTKKFGPLSEAVPAKLKSYPAERLDEISLALLDATSLAELGLTEG